MYGLVNSEEAKIMWPTMLVVGSPNSSPGPTLSISLHQYRVPRKEYCDKTIDSDKIGDKTIAVSLRM